MKCPYCDCEMLLGDLRSSADHAVYWLPQNAEMDVWLLTRKHIEEQGGVVLGQTKAVGFLAKERPDSYYCKNCKVLLTKLK